MLIDSKLLFQASIGSRYTTELRLKVDITAFRKAHIYFIISNTDLVDIKYNISDAVTKVLHCSFIEDFMKTRFLLRFIKQYVLDTFLNLE